MSTFETKNNAISSLISAIRDGNIAIPEIQRPFVWDGIKVRDLMDSMYRGYPIGFIITWKNADTRLKDGTIAAGKSIIIDGQQRITALTAAMVGQEVLNKKYQKKRIKISFNPLEERFEVWTPAIDKSSKWVPDISVLFSEAFYRLRFSRKSAIFLSFANLGILFCPPSFPSDFAYSRKAFFLRLLMIRGRSTFPEIKSS